ncbi:MAG: hypothetical protein COB53_02115 [Elusimicrobia bacterium]|nr:MAG: hypothetical protein COB53_02115 [Elusimicrobiota bacterium]
MRIALLILIAAQAHAAGTFSTTVPNLKLLRPKTEIPEIQGKEVQVPEDLRKAKDTWGTQAQSALLDKLQPTPKTSFRFAVIGDVEPGRFPWQRVFAPKGAFKKQIDAIHAASPDFIVQLGDFVSKGIVKNYRAYVQFLADNVSLPMFHVIGNHDRSKPNGKADKNLYHAVFGPGDFYRDYNGWRIVSLDSSNYAVSDEQLSWLDEVLDTELKTIVATHIVPSYLKKKLHSIDVGEGFTAQGLIPKAYFETGATRFGSILAARGVERVYMGHIHAFGVANVNGVKYVLTAGGGSPLYPLPGSYPKRKKAHYLLVEATSAGLTETVYELDGTTYPITW